MKKISTKKKKVTSKATVKVKVVTVKAKKSYYKPVSEKNKILSPFLVSIFFADDTYRAEGQSITECLDQIKPSIFKSKGLIVVNGLGKTGQTSMRPALIKRLLLGKFNKQVFEKRMLTLMK